MSSQKRLLAGFCQGVIGPGAGGIGIRITVLRLMIPTPKGRDLFRPNTARLVVMGFNDRPQQARHADAIGAHMHGPVLAIRMGHDSFHGL